MDSYDRILDLTGDITANIIAPNAEDFDAEGPHCENGRVRYASKTYENLDATTKAGLNGVTMPRRYGGLNFPCAPYTAINEMIATADAGFENSVLCRAYERVRQCQWTSPNLMPAPTSRA